jgi:hypothetical protein
LSLNSIDPKSPSIKASCDIEHICSTGTCAAAQRSRTCAVRRDLHQLPIEGSEVSKNASLNRGISSAEDF